MGVKLLFLATILTNSISFPVEPKTSDTNLLRTIHFSSRNEVLVCLYVHLETTPKSDKYSNITGNSIGHAYLEITNTYSDPIFLQGFKLNHYESMTVGLWGGTNAMPNNEQGIFINREALYYSKLENTDKCYMLMATSTREKLESCYTYIMDNKFSYNALTYNCVNFASDMWFNLMGQDLKCSLPAVLAAKMLEQKEYGFWEGVTITFSTDRFYSYYKSSGRFKQYTITEEI